MGKKKLELADLRVDSFEVQPEMMGGWGTVEGRELLATLDGGISCVRTCDASCPIQFCLHTAFGYTCDTCRGQFTCGASCEGTCGITCDLSCDNFCPETGPILA